MRSTDDERYELVALSNGGHSLRARSNGETFHPVVGPAAEATHLHVGGTRLVERANTLPTGQELVIWDVGLGAGANALAAIEALAAGCRRVETVRMVSFDRTAAALNFALENAAALGYPRGHEETLRRFLANGEVSVHVGAAVLRWQRSLGDFTVAVRRPEFPAPHAIFFDPYSPAKNPEMWTLEFFAALHAALSPAVPCLLTSYTRSTAVRVTLLLAGFHVGIGPSTGEKDETTVATNEPALLQRPLTRAWVEGKVRASTNAAPLRAGFAAAAAPIGLPDLGRLRAHPQFG